MNIKKLIQLLVCQLCFMCSLHAQPKEYNISRYEEIDGISTRSVSDIKQGSQGYLWFGTFQGLVRFDGYMFKRFINTAGFSNSINKIAEDKNGNIWMTMADGTLTKFNPVNASFTNFVIHFNSGHKTEKPGNAECIFFDSDNNLWLGITRTGLVKVDTNNGNAEVFNVVAENDNFYSEEIKKFYNRVICIYEDEEKLLWLATPNGLHTFNKVSKQMKSLSTRPASPTGFRNDSYRTIVKNGDLMWMGSWGGGLQCYHIKNGKLSTYKFNMQSPESYTSNIVYSMAFKDDTTLYLATADKGFISFNIASKKFAPISNNPVYKNMPVQLWTKLVFDKDHNIWALNEAGLIKIQVPSYKFQFQTFEVGHTDNGAFYELLDMWENDKVKIITTGFAEGIYIINKKTGKKKTLPVEGFVSEEKNQYVSRITQDMAGNVWICSRDFIYQYDKQKEALIKPVQPALVKEKLSNIYGSLTGDRNSNIWIGTIRNGLFKLNLKSNQYEHFSLTEKGKKNIPTNLITSLATDSLNRVWMTSNRGFISYCDPATSIIQPAETINHILKGLYAEKAYDLFVDSHNNLWISTRIGLIKINCNGKEPKHIKTYTAADGLLSDFVTGLAEDKQGNIWGAESLIYTVCMFDFNSSKILHYGLRDGINKPGDIFKLHHTTEDKLLLLAQGGYYECSNAASINKPKQQTLAVTIMAVNSMDKYFQEEIKQHGKVLLEPNENSFYFEFAAIDFSRPEIYQYAYMLDGFDTGWIYGGTRRGVSYTNIPGGNYTFKVKAATVKGEWGNNAVSIPFTIRTPFYKKWWFIFILVLFIGYGLYALYRFRLRKHQEILKLETKSQSLEKEKTQVQYENLKQHLNPHFLFNSLTSLGSLIRIDQKVAGEFLDGMSKIYRYILKSKDNEVVNLMDEIKFVQTFITLQKTRFNDGLLVSINVDDEFGYRKIVPVTLQNLIENAIKHNIIDSESPLLIELFVMDDYLIVRNNLQKKTFVETSNKQGLDNFISLYKYLSEKPLLIEEDKNYFTVKIPLL